MLGHVGLKQLNPRLQGLFVCPRCEAPLDQWSPQELTCREGHAVPVVRGIPRFVESDRYLQSFSFEWNTHAKTQLDTFRGDRSSERILRDKTGLSPADVEGKLVLDAGLGAGRFADVLSRWGALVVGVDLSYAVEAAYDNFLGRRDVVVAQADIGDLPFAPETFDVIVSIGVLHHTPDTRAYFRRLVRLLKPGGRIAIWVYPREGSFVTRAAWIPFTSRIPPRMFYEWCRWFVPGAHRHLHTNWVRAISRVFPFSAQGLGVENDILDTFDGYSPRYHGVHSPEEVEGWFVDSGFVDTRRHAAATSVSGVRPTSTTASMTTPSQPTNGAGDAKAVSEIVPVLRPGTVARAKDLTWHRVRRALTGWAHGSRDTARSRSFSGRAEGRYWWHHLPNSGFVPPVYAVLENEEWAVLEAWFRDTDDKKLWGEANVSALSILQGFIAGSIIRNVVQLGVYAGYSTLLVGFMMRRMGIRRSVLAIDVAGPMCAYTEGWVRQAGLQDYVRVECADSTAPHLPDLARDYFGCAELYVVFIDSSHEYSHTVRELDLWSASIAAGGFIFLHDVSDAAESYDGTQLGGVRRAFTEWTARNPNFASISINARLAGCGQPLVYKDGCGLGILQRQS